MNLTFNLSTGIQCLLELFLLQVKLTSYWNLYPLIYIALHRNKQETEVQHSKFIKELLENFRLTFSRI